MIREFPGGRDEAIPNCGAAFVDWRETDGVEIRYIQTGKPTQKAYIERFIRAYRDEVVTLHVFDSLSQVREATYR